MKDLITANGDFDDCAAILNKKDQVIEDYKTCT